MWRHGSIHNWKRARNRVVVISCTPFPSPHRRRQRRQPKRGPCYASARAFITVPDLLNMYKVKSPGRWGRFGSRQGCNFLILTHVNEVKREIRYAESDRAVISSKTDSADDCYCNVNETPTKLRYILASPPCWGQHLCGVVSYVDHHYNSTRTDRFKWNPAVSLIRHL